MRRDGNQRRGDDAEHDRRRHPANQSTAVTAKPKTAMSAGAAPNDPSATNVAGFGTTKPQFFNPMNAKNAPMPAVTAYLSGSGMARTTAWRAPTSDSATKMTPETNTAPSAV